MEDPKTHTVDDLRMLYSISPAKVRQQLNLNDTIFTDDNWISNIEGILRNCRVSYHLNTQDVHGRRIHELTIVGIT